MIIVPKTMPKACWECFAYEGECGFCQVLGKKIEVPLSPDRPDWCPLITIAECSSVSEDCPFRKHKRMEAQCDGYAEECNRNLQKEY